MVAERYTDGVVVVKAINGVDRLLRLHEQLRCCCGQYCASPSAHCLDSIYQRRSSSPSIGH